MPAGSAARSWSLGILAVGLVGVAAYFALLEPYRKPADVPAPERQRSGAAGEAGTGESGTGESGAGESGVDKTGAGEAGAAGRVDPLRRGRAAKLEVDVAIETLARVLEPEARAVTCSLVRSSRPDQPEAGVAGTWVAGLAALPFGAKPRGPQLVRFQLSGGREHYRITRLLPNDSGRVLLLRGRESITRGKVVDEQHRPVRGARVWLAGHATETDADGSFAIAAMPADSGLPLVVRKPGFATLYRLLSGAQFDELSRESLILRPGAALRVRFTGARGLDAERRGATRYWLLPAGGRDSRLLAHPFFLQAIEAGYEVRDGMAVFGGLPRGAEFKVCVRCPGFAPATSKSVRLDRDVVAVVVRGEQRPVIRGTVVDAAGAPIAGALVTTRPSGRGMLLRDEAWLLPPEAYFGAVDAVRTDASGRFESARLATAGRSSAGKGSADAGTTLTVGAAGFASLEYALTGPIPAPLHLTLPEVSEFGEPGLSLVAGKRLPAKVVLRVHDAGGDHGPYTWTTAEPFPLRITHRSLLRIRVRSGDTEPVVHDSFVVAGPTTLHVNRQQEP